MQGAKKSTDSECDALISITWILEFINGTLIYWVLLQDMTRRKGLEREKQKKKHDRMRKTELKKEKSRRAGSFDWFSANGI